MSGTPVAEYHYTLAVSDHTEILGRSTAIYSPAAPTPAQPRSVTGPAVDIITAPVAELTIAGEQSETTIRYSPLLTLMDIESTPQPALIHAGVLRTSWHDHRVRLGLAEEGAYGDLSFITNPPSTQAPGTPPPPLQLLPPGPPLRFALTRTTFTTTESLSRRLTLETSLGYLASGGFDKASRATLPLQYGPFAALKSRFVATRQDALGVEISGSHSQFTEVACAVSAFAATCSGPGGDPRPILPTVDVVSVTGDWQRRWTRSLDFSLKAGFATLRARARPSDAFQYTVLPVALVRLVEHLKAPRNRMNLAADVQLAPVQLQLTGAVQPRVDGNVTFDWSQKHIMLQSLARVSKSVASSDPQAGVLFDGEASATYRFDRHFAISWGTRADVQVLDAGQRYLLAFGFVRVAAATSPFHR